MFKKWKWLMLVMVLVFPVQLLVHGTTEDAATEEVEEIEEQRSNDMLRYQSNQYTQPEQEDGALEENRLLEGYELVTENDQLALYVEEASLALQIENKQTGHIWNSGVDRTQEYNLNDTWLSMAHSALTISYMDEGGDESSESILSNDSNVELELVEDGFNARVDMEEADIGIALEVRLTEDSLEFRVPQEAIEEGDNLLTKMRVYPFLGAEEGTANESGYLFIPDGSGALMRFSEQQLASSAPYQAAIYGEDVGFTRTVTSEEESRTREAQQITVPVYGVTHAANQDAYVGVIEEGQSFAEILAYPSGVSTDFHWITAEYNYRYQYYQPTSQSMNGYNVFQQEMNGFDIQEKITFLSNDEANYTGMAKSYKNDLQEQERLPEVEDTVDVRLEFLGGEVKSGLIWDSVQVMTSINELPQMVNRLQQQDVTDMHLVYRGWSEGGLTGALPQKFPLEDKLGSSSDFEEVNQQMEEQGIPLYYYTDYTKAYEGAGDFSGSTDIARKINAEPIFGNQQREYYYLNPVKTEEMMAADREQYQDHQMHQLAIDTTGNTLFSDFNSNTIRSASIPLYQDIFSQLKDTMESIALYTPNDYMFPVMDRYLDVPMYSSNYQFVTDTVPFLQIVLKGDVPYYASFANFQYNPEDELLRMIEYGAYPSFYLTSEPSHELMHTPSSDLYTSQFSDWEEKIVNQYNTMKQSLEPVAGEAINKHIVHETGVVEVQYTNGISIYVNYTNQAKDIRGVTVEAKGYQVVEGGDPS
ncbi:DUF5696 domain-containing protein [Gracilibacillus timonensis]|uniref:DUF5696 domain-containing protein n=1 Tax=Gracilibacillus timonensis TaxID=1816696 RepID=UPI0008266060|nr:DUF5696 domain-containing protein [Gracilibacillus timonensis]